VEEDPFPHVDVMPEPLVSTILIVPKLVIDETFEAVTVPPPAEVTSMVPFVPFIIFPYKKDMVGPDVVSA